MESEDEKRQLDFDIDLALERIEEAIEPYPKAALFELAEDGFDSPFEQLVACVISVRTRDETTIPVARRLFEAARTPDEMAKLTPKKIESLIRNATFHESKSHNIHAIADQVVQSYNGELPCDYDAMTSFKGSGQSARTWSWESPVRTFASEWISTSTG